MACTNTIEQAELAGAVRIVTGYQTAANFIRANSGYPCRMTCAICRNPWAKTATEEINVLYAGKKQLYICTDCTGHDELKSVEVRGFKPIT